MGSGLIERQKKGTKDIMGLGLSEREKKGTKNTMGSELSEIVTEELNCLKVKSGRTS